MVKSKIIKKSVIAIGNFDGIHKGHQKIFTLGKKLAKKNNTKFGVVTFSPLPSEFFRRQKVSTRLTRDDIKINLLKQYKIDFFLICKFNKTFSLTSADNFIKNIIVKKIQAKFVLVGKNFKFGHQRKGNISLLKKYGKLFNFKTIDLQLIKEKNTKISSTRIRLAIQKGNMELASRLLGRHWSVKEKVIPGRKIGRKLGFRTANIEIKNNINPKTGVYVVRVKIGNKAFDGVANFGFAPTFLRKKLVLEINLFKKIAPFYGKIVEVIFIKRLRDEKKFKNRNLLITQIKKDITKAKLILQNERHKS